MTRWPSRAVAVLGLAGLIAGAQARAADVPVLDPGQRQFVLANTLFALLHEFGHAILRDNQVPLLGLEENSADTLAVMTLILVDRDQPDAQPRFATLLGLTAIGNYLVWKAGIERDNPEFFYWTSHDLSVRRAARMLCLLYGSDTQRFAWLPERLDMPEIRADTCTDEYRVALRAVEWVLASYGRAPENRDAAAATPIEVVYKRSSQPAHAAVADALRASGIVEATAQFMAGRLRFSGPLSVVAKRCGSPNAYWDAEYREIVLCYELIEGATRLAQLPAYRQARALVGLD